MFKFMRGAYKPPTAETVLDYSGDEMPAAPKRRQSKERAHGHRERRSKEGDSRSAVSSRSSKSSHASSRGAVEDEAEKERRRRERRERKSRDCSSSVSSSSASTSRVSRRSGSLVVKISDLEPMAPIHAQPAAAAMSTAVAGRKRSPTMPTTLPTMRSLASEERDRSHTPRPIREQRSDPTLKASPTKAERKPSVEPAIAAPVVPAAPVLPASKPAHVVVPAPAGPVPRARTASPGFGRQFPAPPPPPPPQQAPHGIATPPHTPGSKALMAVPEVAQQLPPTPPAAADDLAKHHSEVLTGALVRRPHRPHIHTGSEVRFASPATDGARTPRSGWKPAQHRHHSEGYEQGYFPPAPPPQSLSREHYYRQDSTGSSRHKGELPPPPDYLYWQRPQSAAGYYHQQGYYPPQQNYSPPASHAQSTPVGPPSPPESAKSLPSPLEREGSTRSSSAKPVRHSLPPPTQTQAHNDYYAYYQYHVFTPQAQQAAPQVPHVPRYPPPPPTAADIEFLPLEQKRERKRRHSMHYPTSYEPQHIPYHHHSRVMTPVEGVSPTSRPFHEFPPAGSSLKRLVPSRLALVTSPHGSESHRLPQELTPGGSRDVFQFMDEEGRLERDNETTVTSMIAVSSGYPTRERRPPMQRFVRKRVPEVGGAVVQADEGSVAGERMERGESVASGVPLPPPVVAKEELVEVENVRPVFFPPESCEEVAVFEEEEENDDVEEKAVEEREEVEEESPLVLEGKVVEVEVAADVLLPDATEEVVEAELEQEQEEEGEQEEFEYSEEEEEDDDAEPQEEEEDQEEEEEEEEDCDTVVGLNLEEQEAQAEYTRSEMVMEGEGVSVINGRLETLEECHDEEEEEDEEQGDRSEDEHEDEDNEADEDEDEEEEDIHLDLHHQPPNLPPSDTDLGVTLDPEHDDDHDQTAEGFLANLANSSPPASSIFSTHSDSDTPTVITLDSMFPSTTTSSASSAPSTLSTLTSTDYSSGSSSTSYTPQYMHPGVFAYAPSPPPSTVTSSSSSSSSFSSSAGSENLSVTTQYPVRGHRNHNHIHNLMTPPRSAPGTRTTSPLMYKRTPFMADPRMGMGMGIPPMMTEAQPQPQAFPRFTSLNLRLLRHLEGELMELERMLGEVEVRLEACHATGYTDSPGGSVRSKFSGASSTSTSSSLELEGKRADIMDALVWKLGQYNQALVNYQTMMDTFGPVINPCSTPATPSSSSSTSPRRPASRDSGVASSRCSSAGIRLSTSELDTTNFGCGAEEVEACEHIPGGWTDQHQPHGGTHEGPPESQIPRQEQEEEPRANPSPKHPILLEDTIIAGNRHIHKPPVYNPHHGSSTSTQSSHPTTPPAPPPQKEVTLTDILAPPVLILTVLVSLEWISSWGRVLGLMMVFGMGRAWSGARGGVKAAERERGRSRGRVRG